MAKLMGMMGLGGDGIVAAADALPGRSQAMRVSDQHYVLRGARDAGAVSRKSRARRVRDGVLLGDGEGARDGTTRETRRRATRATATTVTDGARDRCAR